MSYSGILVASQVERERNKYAQSQNHHQKQQILSRPIMYSQVKHALCQWSWSRALRRRAVTAARACARGARGAAPAPPPGAVPRASCPRHYLPSWSPCPHRPAPASTAARACRRARGGAARAARGGVVHGASARWTRAHHRRAGTGAACRAPAGGPASARKAGPALTARCAPCASRPARRQRAARPRAACVPRTRRARPAGASSVCIHSFFFFAFSAYLHPPLVVSR